MAAKPSIASIARELGVPPIDILTKVREAGEWVPSTRAPLLAPVERLVRELFPATAAPPRERPARAPRVHPGSTPAPTQPTVRELFTQSAHDPDSPLHRPPGAGPRRREWYRGDPPEGLTLFLLHHHVMPQNLDPWHAPRRPAGAQYWDDEVLAARHLASTWVHGILEAGFTQHDILGWIRARVAAQHAVELHLAGIEPGDMGFHYANNGRTTLADRLTYEGWTVPQVIGEVANRAAISEPDAPAPG